MKICHTNKINMGKSGLPKGIVGGMAVGGVKMLKYGERVKCSQE